MTRFIFGALAVLAVQAIGYDNCMTALAKLGAAARTAYDRAAVTVKAVEAAHAEASK